MNIVIIPAYNEEAYLAEVVKKAKEYAEVLVIDDGSDDKTADTAKVAGAKVLRHAINLGKGAALKTACDYAMRKGYTKMVVMDGDGQHDPAFIPDFFSHLDTVPLILGYRKALKSSMPFFKRFGNSVITTTTRILYGVQFKDTQSGFRAFTAKAYKKIRWKANDYSLESEMLIRALKNHITYKEIEISTIYHEKYKGTSTLDGVKIVINLIKWRCAL